MEVIRNAKNPSNPRKDLQNILQGITFYYQKMF